MEAAMKLWKENLAVGTTENPDRFVSLYAKEAVLWGTLSSTRRDDPAAIRNYFVNAYTNLSKLTINFRIGIFGSTTTWRSTQVLIHSRT